MGAGSLAGDFEGSCDVFGSFFSESVRSITAGFYIALKVGVFYFAALSVNLRFKQDPGPGLFNSKITSMAVANQAIPDICL